MNTKIIVALVLGIALMGLTGAASAWDFDDYGSTITSNTEIIGTYITSESQTIVFGMPVELLYESLLVAELVYPTYPPVDMSWSASELEGSDYSFSTATSSTPTGSIDEYEITNPSELEGYTTFFNCAMWGTGDPQRVIPLPMETSEPLYVGWYSSHGEGGAYPTSIWQSTNIYWP